MLRILLTAPIMPSNTVLLICTMSYSRQRRINDKCMPDSAQKVNRNCEVLSIASARSHLLLDLVVAARVTRVNGELVIRRLLKFGAVKTLGVV